MPRIVLAEDAPQGEEEWLKLHIGRPTSSNFHKIITPSKLELSKQRSAFAYQLAAERLLNRSFSPEIQDIMWLRKGREEEPKAVSQYEALSDLETYPISMILTDDRRFGASPDRLVKGDDRRGLEIKSVFPPKMIEYLVEGPGPNYRVQMLGQFWVGDLEINDLYCYNEETPQYFRSWKRAEVINEIKVVESHMTRFGDELDAMVGKLNATGFFTRALKPATVLDQLAQAMIEVIQQQESAAALLEWQQSQTTEANLAMLDPEQRERIDGMVAHKRAELRKPMPGIINGWGG